jgi:hypothetical protein
MHSSSFFQEIVRSCIIDREQALTSFELKIDLASGSLWTSENLTSFFFYLHWMTGNSVQLARMKRSIASFHVKKGIAIAGYQTLKAPYGYYDYVTLYHLPEHSFSSSLQFFTSHFSFLSFFTTLSLTRF